jgi:hypothetical protein
VRVLPKLCRSSSCNFLQSAIISSFLGPNVLSIFTSINIKVQVPYEPSFHYSIKEITLRSSNLRYHVILYMFQTTTNSVVFSPQANYTDWSTATDRRILMPTFADRGVSRGQRAGFATAVNLSFLDRSRYFSFKWLLIYPHEAEWTPFQPHCYAENLVAQGIEPGIFVCSLELWPLDHRGGLLYMFRRNILLPFSG